MYVHSLVLLFFGQVEKIAHERGEISTELSALLKDKEAKIDELTNKVKAHGKFTDKVEGDYKAKLDRKNKVRMVQLQFSILQFSTQCYCIINLHHIIFVTSLLSHPSKYRSKDPTLGIYVAAIFHTP